ncbi:hypothetical protein ACFVRB_22280 [Streptomyces nojiriensis]|uniref:hypothetical protein n=1 Tax=Streptomyces nojiriensis TaxID=66374 RepID=UPI0036D8F3E3
MFIGRFRVPGDEVRLAYLFLHEEDMDMGGTAPEDGEAVVLVQPGGRIPSFASVGAPGTRGRTLWRWGPDHEEVPVEWLTDLTPIPPEPDEAANPLKAGSRGTAAERFSLIIRSPTGRVSLTDTLAFKYRTGTPPGPVKEGTGGRAGRPGPRTPARRTGPSHGAVAPAGDVPSQAH